MAAVNPARADYEKRRKFDAHNGRARMVDPVGTRRRIQGLVALGWTYPVIGGRLGVTAGAVYKLATVNTATILRSTAERVAAVYEDMSMSVPPRVTRVQKRDAAYAQTVARKRGWVPPLAWDQIDNPDEKPNVGNAVRSHGRVRTLATYRRHELLAEWEHLRSCGVTLEHAARQLGITPDAIERALLRDRQGAA